MGQDRTNPDAELGTVAQQLEKCRCRIAVVPGRHVRQRLFSPFVDVEVEQVPYHLMLVPMDRFGPLQ
jgi:hypothetical protein